MDRALTATEVAEVLNIPVSTVLLLCRRGELRSFRAGRHVRVRREWQEEFVHAAEGGPAPSTLSLS